MTVETEEKKDEKKEYGEKIQAAYVDSTGKFDEEEAKYATRLVERINKALEIREQNSLVFNGIPYTQAYEYNRQKAINYSPPKDPEDDREVSMGIPHEKIIGFMALFLKYIFKRRVKVYDKKGQLVQGTGAIYDLAIEHSRRLEQFPKLLALIYFEVFAQGNAFVMDEWEVKQCTDMVPKDKDGNKLSQEEIDYTYEFLDGLSYEEGKMYQTRRAVSKILDGRSVIFDNPEIEDIQQQPMITIEDEISRADAEAEAGTLKRWASVPKDREEINAIVGEKNTLFDANRLKEANTRCIRHIVLDKENNRFNVMYNGIMMLSRKTPLNIFYPRKNYPIANFAAERLTGSIYARGIPAKTKFNADFIDWALKAMALKFEQGLFPAILSKGRYTITRDIFRAGKVTHGIGKDDYEKADPDNDGLTGQDMGFVEFLKAVLESQTINPTSAGELSENTTATEIATVDQAQRDKLASLLDGLTLGFMELDMRRAETIECKYTQAKEMTVVDGRNVPVYYNFSVSISGVNHQVEFDEAVGSGLMDYKKMQADLFKKSFDSKHKEGNPTEYYRSNPKELKNQYDLYIEIHPERHREMALQMITMWQEFQQLIATFGPAVDTKELQKIYLDTTNRPDTIFQTPELAAMQMPPGEGAGQNMGSFGRPAQPKVGDAARQVATGGAR